MLLTKKKQTNMLDILCSKTGIRRTLIAVWIAAISTFLCSRLLFLDQDLPPFAFAFYQPIDEFYYTISAFNLLKFGAWTHKQFAFLPLDEPPFYAFQNLLTYCGLALLGNNFFGLRVSAVVCGLVVFVGTLWCLHRASSEDDSFRKFVVGLAAAYMVGDFFFLQNSRVNDPTMFMMAAIVIVMVAFESYGRTEPSLVKSAFVGLLAGAAATFVYVYLLYIVAAAGVTIIASRWRFGISSVLSHVAAFGAGAMVAAIIFGFFVYSFFGLTPPETVSLLLEVGGRRAEVLKSNLFVYLLRNFKHGVVQNLTQNFFAYNPALLYVYLVSLPVFCIRVVMVRRALDVFVLASLVLRVALSVVIPFDYFEKKLIQIFPLVVYVIAVAAMSARSIYNSFPEERKSILFAGFACYALLLPFVVAFIGGGREPAVHFQKDLVSNSGLWIAPILLLLALVRSDRLTTRLVAFSVTCVLLIPGLWLSGRFVFLSPTFKYRDSLIRAAPQLNGKILAGGLSYGMRLYNTSTPIMNFYMYYSHGYDKFAEYGNYLYRNHLVDGTILYVPFHEAQILKPAYGMVMSGGLVLSGSFDVGDVEQKYNLAIYEVSTEPGRPRDD